MTIADVPSAPSTGASHIAAVSVEAADESDYLIGIKPQSNRSDNERLLAKVFSYLGISTSQHPFNSKAKRESKPSSRSIYSKTTDFSDENDINCLEITDEQGTHSKLARTRSISESSRSWRHHSNKLRRKWQLIYLILSLIILLLTSLLILILLLNFIREYKQISSINLHNESRLVDSQFEAGRSSRWLISSPKCHIPVIDAWHESINSYVKTKPKLDCPRIFKKYTNATSSLTYVRANKLYFSNKSQEIMEDCCYRQVTRKEDNDDGIYYNETCNKIKTDGWKAPFDLIKVECPSHNYTNIHSFILHDHEEEEALKRVSSRKLDVDKYYNVIFVGVDTISRLNGIRQLNNTLDFLKEKYESITFNGYNKVGENTFPNLIPLLTGLRPEQLTETQCWLATNYSQETETGDDYLDNCKYLWNYYQELGYITYYSEDWPKASTFNYLKQGFKREPTTFYGRPYTLARDKLLFPPVDMGCSSCQLDRPIVELDLANLKTFIQENNNNPYFAFHWINCPQHDDLNGASQVDYILKKFFGDIHDITKDDRTFVVFFSDHGYRWNDFVSTRVGHYESSLPMMTIAAPKKFIQQQPELYQTIKSYQSVLLTPFDLFKSFIDIRNLGYKLEEPITTNQPDLANKRVTRPTATSTTKSPKNKFEDLAYTSLPTATTTIKQLEIQDGLAYKQKFKTISILEEHNSTELDRSCIEAGIPDNYCVCHEFENTDLNSTDVIGAAYYYVYVHLYRTLQESKDKCHFLDLKRINKAELFDLKHMKSNAQGKRRKREDIEEYLDNHISTTTSRPANPATDEFIADEHHYLPNREYNIRVTTTPGEALFQEVLRFYGDNLELCKSEVESTRKIIEDTANNFTVKHSSVLKMNELCEFSIHSDSISRLNLYRDQSKCVKSNIELKKICYCKNLDS